MAGLSTKETATIYPTIFWVTMTTFRFLSALLPGTSSQKLGWFQRGIVTAGVLTLGLVWMGLGQVACYLSAVLFGMGIAPLYPLVFSLSSEFGRHLEEGQTTNITTAAMLAEGTMTMATGQLMQHVSVHMFYLCLAMMGLVMWVDRNLIVSILERNRQELPLEMELVSKQPPLNNE